MKEKAAGEPHVYERQMGEHLTPVTGAFFCMDNLASKKPLQKGVPMAYWNDRYQPDSLCVFCLKPVETIRRFYYSSGLPRTSYDVPMHPRCYSWQFVLICLRVISTLMVAVLFYFLAGWVPVLSQWVMDAIFMTTMIIVVGAFLASMYFIMSGYLQMRARIKKYIEHHTDYEDYYASDRQPWRRSNIP